VKKTYIMLYSASTGSIEEIKEWINSEEAISFWRRDLPNMFYLVSEGSAADLAASFTTFYRGRFPERKPRFLIMEASANRQGWLPKESWYVLRNHSMMPKKGS
jgi:hypothetical protein